ncbi:MAG TPA: M67 family metallopeptidase [Candidatus Dormibacteraeota bacterium]|nr:M67 family metallopeptidase [Candidatus Dormibacteraeota bacterium]
MVTDGGVDPTEAAASGSAAASAAHPGPGRVELPADVRQAMIAHARAEYPNEMCGIVIGDRAPADGGRALRWEPARNEAASPYRYRLHPDDLLRLTLATWDDETVFWAVAHSHVRAPAVPSPTDIGAATYPDALYVLVSLSEEQADPGTGEPSVRAWRIVDGAVHEVAIR